MRELTERFHSEGLAIVSVSNNAWAARIPGTVRAIQGRLPSSFDAASIATDGTAVIGVSPTDGVMLCALDGSVLGKCPLKMSALSVSLSPTRSKAILIGRFYGPDRRSQMPQAGFLVSKLWGNGHECQPSVAELSIDSTSSDFRDPCLSWSPDERYFVYESSGNIFRYDIEHVQSKFLCDGKSPRWAPNGKWISFRSPDGHAFLIEPTLGERRQLMAGRLVHGALHWSPDSQYLFFSEAAPLTDQLLHFFTAARFAVYRMSDGATEPLIRTMSPMNDRFFDWAIIPPKLRSN